MPASTDCRTQRALTANEASRTAFMIRYSRPYAQRQTTEHLRVCLQSVSDDFEAECNRQLQVPPSIWDDDPPSYNDDPPPYADVAKLGKAEAIVS